MTVRTHPPSHEPSGAPAHTASRATGTLTGVLAVFAALGTSHLVAGLLQPSSSPFAAVGETFIDLTPSWLKSLAINVFGTGDKTALLIGMALVMAGIGAGVGLLARHERSFGLAAVAAIGLVGLAAVLARPGATGVSVVAPGVSIIAGTVTLWWLHRITAVASGEPGARPAVTRRTFVRSSVGVAAVAGVGALTGQLAGTRRAVAASRAGVGSLEATATLAPVPAGADFLADGGLPYITPNAEFYRIDTALFPPRVSAAEWSLRIHGMVDRELVLSFDDLVSRGLVSRRVTFTCVSYEVGGDLVGTAEWTGVDLRELLAQVGVSAGADQILSRSVDGFSASTPLETVLEPDRGAMLAVNMNGEPLPVEHGFPVRMLVPGLYGYVSATKWISELELTTYAAQQAYWTKRGWAERGPVKIASKVVSSRASGSVLTVTGTAWATHIGVSAVQVRLDDGEWIPARLGAGEDADTWRMWRADLRDVSPGEHTVACRATDADGTVQSELPAPPVPDGATGLHTARVTVG